MPKIKRCSLPFIQNKQNASKIDGSTASNPLLQKSSSRDCYLAYLRGFYFSCNVQCLAASLEFFVETHTGNKPSRCDWRTDYRIFASNAKPQIQTNNKRDPSQMSPRVSTFLNSTSDSENKPLQHHLIGANRKLFYIFPEPETYDERSLGEVKHVLIADC